MSYPDTCPHCGARRTKARLHFECDTIYFRANSYERGYSCFERQLAAKDAEIERLKQAVLDEREACAKICESHVCTSECSAYGLGSNCEFVISAEIRARGE